MKEKKNKLTQFMVIFIGLIMVSSAFAVVFYGFNDPNSKRNYKGIKFTKLDYGYEAKVNGKTENFIYFPGDIESINVSSDIISVLQNKSFFVMTSDPADRYNQTIAYMEYNSDKLLRDLNKGQIGFGYTNQTGFRHVVTCVNASPEVPILYVRRGANETAIKAEGNCLIIESRDQNDLIAAYERVMYIIIGVMDK